MSGCRRFSLKGWGMRSVGRRWRVFTGSGAPELLCDVAGLVCVSVFGFLWWLPLGFLFAGVGLVGLGWRFDRDRR